MVKAAGGRGMTADHAERGHVLRTTGTAAHHNVAADAAELVDEDAGAEDGEIVDDDLAGELRRVADDAAVAHENVVSDVATLHEEVVAAHDSTALGGGAAVDGHVLTDGVVVAHLSGGLFAAELEILGNGADDGTGEDAVTVADAAAGENGDGVHQRVVVADDDIGVDVAEGPDLTVLADLGFGMDVC